MSIPAAPSRIELVDALRGSALAGLFLVHCLEHFEMGRGPASSPEWLQALDTWTRNATFFLFASKAYAILATLLGVAFVIHLTNAVRRGEAYRARFISRLVVLAAIGSSTAGCSAAISS